MLTQLRGTFFEEEHVGRAPLISYANHAPFSPASCVRNSSKATQRTIQNQQLSDTAKGLGFDRISSRKTSDSEQGTHNQLLTEDKGPRERLPSRLARTEDLF